ncbi:DUF4350 domain-containing protein [Methylophilus sp. 5]|uniref:DUF4350 domain-containing protein n=1 Tax=Methylophilus sp. 5 TaxID=1112274 RepID=UPI0004BB174F|nr:DUF4350 domain-containing protein [Methylophilus sp. 5]
MANTLQARRLSFARTAFKRLANWWHHRLAVPALLLLTLALGAAAWQFKVMADTTHNHRNTLSAASIQVLQQLPDRIEVTAFCSNSPYKGRYFRKSISALLQRYQSVHPNLQVQFIDPASAPTLAREWQIKKEGEMVIRYRGQQQHLYLPYTEEAFTNVLLQLQHGARAPLIFAADNGEPALQDSSPQGASQLGQALQAAGLRTLSATSLTTLPNQQASLPTLVLAGATHAYTAAQNKVIQAHIDHGGNLVWLLDTPQQQGLDTLATQLGFTLSPGLIIDPANRQFDIPLHALSTQRYASQGPTQDFALRTFFDSAHAIQRPRQAGDAWRTLPLVAVADHGWVSAAYQPMQPASQALFNPKTDTQGPATVMLALEKDRATGERQRVLIIGSRQFFTNAQLQRGGNLALGMQSLQWVVNNQPSVSLAAPPLRDSVIALPATQTWLMVLFNSFQFGLPAMLLWAGWLSWRRKQRV